MPERNPYRKSERRRRRSAFKARQLTIARRLEGTTGLEKYAGKDRQYSKNEAMRSARAIAAAAGIAKYGKREMLRRSLAARRRG